MDQGTAQTVRDIEATRERIGSNLHALEERLPAPAKLARRATGVALGGGITGTAFWFAVRRIRGRRQRSKMEEARNVVVNIVPDRWMKTIEKQLKDGDFKNLAMGFGAAWVLIRLAELRQLRGMRRQLTVG
ncbi:MAG: DUF3618 domain-containing protein [Actinomycetota bacterium]|nr:DUF3618 domain-containing protein [Actinomycetota bacterium]